jgi:hypothetical protein
MLIAFSSRIAPQRRKHPTRCGRDGFVIAAQKASMRHARPRNGSGDFFGSGDDDSVVVSHESIAQRAFVC